MELFSICERRNGDIKDDIKSRNLGALIDYVDGSSLPEDYKQAMLLDLEYQANTGVATSQHCKQVINSRKYDELYGLFDASYFPSLGFDGIKFKPLPLPTYDGFTLDSPVVPIKVTNATEGFMAPAVVALFPENHFGGVQKANDKIFYFIDRFAARHINKTKLILSKFVNEGTFSRVKDFTLEEAEDYSVHWIWLHEYFHRVSPAPVPEYLDMKSYKPLAGLEESRVDMMAVRFIYEKSNLPKEKATKICEFILAERLLRYAVEGIPNPNYDAIGSQVLANFLKNNGYLKISNNKLSIADDYMEGVYKFTDKIHDLEKYVESESRENVKGRLIEFVNSNLNMAYSSRQYLHDSFFLMVRDSLVNGLNVQM